MDESPTSAAITTSSPSRTPDRASYYRAYHERNRDKKIEATRQWKLANPERAKEGQRRYNKSDTALHHRLMHRFGISLERYREMEQAQGGLCKICQKKPRGRLHIDHDHETDEVRGLLCGPCNRSLGMMQDDPGRLRAAAEYLEATRPPLRA